MTHKLGFAHLVISNKKDRDNENDDNSSSKLFRRNEIILNNNKGKKTVALNQMKEEIKKTESSLQFESINYVAC